MRTTARQTRENRTITVDFQNESTYFPAYNGFCGSCSTPFIEPETSKFSSQFSA
jgi:hypothetical protein